MNCLQGCPGKPTQQCGVRAGGGAFLLENFPNVNLGRVQFHIIKPCARSLCNHSVSESFGATTRTVEFGEHLGVGQLMEMLPQKALGEGRRENVRSKEMFQENHSCRSAKSVCTGQ